MVRLHRCHFPLIAEHLDLMTRDQFVNATARTTDRLLLLAALIDGHTRPGDPLRLAADALLGAAKHPERVGTIEASAARYAAEQHVNEPSEFQLTGERQ